MQQPVVSRGAKIADLLPLLYQTEERYGWSVGMRAITQMLLHQLRLPPGALLEVGCGAGSFAETLTQSYPQRTVIGIDIRALAVMLANAKSKRATFAQASLLRLPFGAESFAAIVALDSFDQEGIDMPEALAESWRVLQPGGFLLLRVSAFEFLGGGHDVAFHTGRRYTQPELTALLRVCGFEPTRATYANMLLLLPVLVQRFLERNGLLRFTSTLYTSAVLNRLIQGCLYQESRWLRRWNLPVGISLYVVATKKERRDLKV